MGLFVYLFVFKSDLMSFDWSISSFAFKVIVHRSLFMAISLFLVFVVLLWVLSLFFFHLWFDHFLHFCLYSFLFIFLLLFYKFFACGYHEVYTSYQRDNSVIVDVWTHFKSTIFLLTLAHILCFCFHTLHIVVCIAYLITLEIDDFSTFVFSPSYQFYRWLI